MVKDNYPEYLENLIAYTLEVGNSIAGVKHAELSEGVIYAEGIGKKIFSHISCCYALLKGIKINFANGTYIEFIDNSSIAVLTRAALEAYLIFNHVFISAETEEEMVFRFHCWDLAGFIERKDFLAITDEGKETKKREAKSIQEKIIIVKENKVFQQLTTKQQSQIIEKGNWRLNKSWHDLAFDAGFNREYFKDIYSYLCSYAHTGRLSALQIMQLKNKTEQYTLAEPFIAYCLVIISKYLFDYVELIPATKAAFDKNQEAQTIAKIWKGIGESLKKENGES